MKLGPLPPERRRGAGLLLLLLIVALTGLCMHTKEPPRLAKARSERGEEVRGLCEQAGLRHPPGELFLRVFKHERVVECWARDAPPEPFRLIRSFPVLASSGVLGPKRREGDLQVPEGFYSIDLLNPNSSFHLSMRVNYPNASDLILSHPDRPGFDIYLHGGGVSVGCVAIGDEPIELLYLLVDDAARLPMPIHIFPARMEGPEWEKLAADHPEHAAFWADLQPGYAAFEKDRQVPAIEVGPDGRYRVK
jgi:murein L,D-transpeptidase YafK